MGVIIDTLLNSVLPVALIFVIGLVMGRRHVFGNPEAESLFKFIARISAPAIIINIIITTDMASTDLRLASLYIISELIVYAASFWLCRLLFDLDFKNALLCGLAASFANHVLFVYPITQFAFAPEMSLPVRSIITIDVILFIITVVILDIHSNPTKALWRAIGSQIKNPLFAALIIGIAMWAICVRHFAITRLFDDQPKTGRTNYRIKDASTSITRILDYCLFWWLRN